mmetsp:Transcript_121957/g.345663  ORF Transcript_121957/g.345663 Transcript_121957/m.345663 type:complete len:372 (-) Transcript_121957:79-1194(-)
MLFCAPGEPRGGQCDVIVMGCGRLNVFTSALIGASHDAHLPMSDRLAKAAMLSPATSAALLACVSTSLTSSWSAFCCKALSMPAWSSSSQLRTSSLKPSRAVCMLLLETYAGGLPTGSGGGSAIWVKSPLGAGEKPGDAPGDSPGDCFSESPGESPGERSLSRAPPPSEEPDGVGGFVEAGADAAYPPGSCSWPPTSGRPLPLLVRSWTLLLFSSKSRRRPLMIIRRLSSSRFVSSLCFSTCFSSFDRWISRSTSEPRALMAPPGRAPPPAAASLLPRWLKNCIASASSFGSTPCTKSKSFRRRSSSACTSPHWAPGFAAASASICCRLASARLRWCSRALRRSSRLARACWSTAASCAPGPCGGACCGGA